MDDGSPSISAPGEFAGRYVVERELGRGASATVLLARDTVTGRQVAVKILRPELAESLGAQRFLKEIRLTAGLSHPHIVQVLDTGEWSGRPFFVIPYMEGDTLRARLNREKQLSLESALAIVKTLAGALDYAHAHGIIHRDVKPENILFAENEAFLADFGVARALEHAFGETTSAGIVRGTPAYMSPEQASGDADIDGRSDIYTLACVFYEMLAGMPAFSGPTPQSVISQRITHGPRSVRVFRPSVPAPVERVMEKAMMPAPADRWQTAGEFARALEGAMIAGDDHSGRAVDTTSTSRAPNRPRARWIWIAGAAAVAVAAGLLYFTGIPLPWATSPAPAVIGILPFDAPDPADSLWRHGLIDVLTRNFDGAGPLRAVPPSVVLGAWHGTVADTLTAAQFGRRVGAGVVVFGALRRMGPDSVRLSATLLDVAAGRKLRDIDVYGGSTRVLALADSLTVVTLVELGRTRPIGSVRQRWLSSTRLEVLKPFLQGEQFLRRNDYARAESAYVAALAADSTFALGWHRMRTVTRARLGELNATSLDYARRAGRLNRGRLALRDSLLVVADSLLAAVPRSRMLYDAASDLLVRRSFAALDSASRTYPDDPEVWEQLGEARYHYGDRVGIAPDRALAAFDSAVTLDPDYAPAYWHAVALTIGLRSVSSAARLVNQFTARIGNDHRYVALAAILADSGRSTAARIVQSTGMNGDEIREVAQVLRRAPAYGRLATEVLRVAATMPAADTGSRAIAAAWHARFLSYFGRAREAWANMTPLIRSQSTFELIYLAQAGAMPADTADALFRAWLSGTDMQQVLLTLAWWGQRGDTAALRVARVRFEKFRDTTATQTPRGAGSAANRTLADYGTSAARFYAALAVHDTSAALAAGAALTEALCTWMCSPQRLIYARVLTARGRSGEAARFLDAHVPTTVPFTMSEVLWNVERARAAAVAGDTAVGRSHYAFARAVWREADPALRASLDAVDEMLKGGRPR